jgi:hypothetical protein
MVNGLLLELQRELGKTDRLLLEASRYASDLKKMEDGSVRRPSTKKRKPQKLTPEQRKKQKADQKLVKKVKDKLKSRKYKSRETGKDLSFNTAYNRNHPKAVDDFNKAMEKARESKGDSKKEINYSVAATLNDEQYDLLSRMNNGRDMREMSLVEERTMRDIMTLLMDIHEEVREEIGEPPPKKKRKTRSDKGKKRGPYRKRVKEKLTTSLEEEGIEAIDLNAQEASDITEEEVKETKDVLDERAKEREEQTGEEEPPKKKRKTRSDKGKGRGSYKKRVKDTNPNQSGEDDATDTSPPKEEPPFVEGAPLLEQPSYVQKAEIKDRLERAFRDKLSRGTSEQIEKLEEKLQDPSLNDKEKRDLKEQIKELEEKDLASTRKSTRTLIQRISETVDALDELTEDQVQQMVDAYGSGAVMVEETMRNQGLDGLQSYIDEETKKDGFKPPTPPPTVEQLNESIKEATDKVSKAQKNLSEADEDTDEETLKQLKESLKDAENSLSSLKSDLENYDGVQQGYAQKLGNYLAISHAQKSIVEDPEFGLKEFPTDGDVHDKEKHQENVRRVQGRRFKKMTEEQRNTMVGRIKEEIDEVSAHLEDDGKGLNEEEKKSLQGKLANLKASETALNTIRMINSEGVIDGYAEVPDRLLELARQTGSEAWEEGISMLSQQGTNPSKTRELIESVTENLDTEDFKAVVGGEQGPYGDMLDLLDDNYCPGSPTNNSKGVGDKKLSPSDDPCPNPLSDNMKKLLRDYMSGGFVNLHTVEKESRGDGYYKPKGDGTGPSKKVKEQMKLFWGENKDKFFEVFVDGVDQSTGQPYTEEQREAAGEEFRTRWRIEETRSSIDGIQLYSDSTKKFRWEQIQQELERVKSLDSTTKRLRLRDIRTRLTQLFDDTATQENEPTSSNKQANYFNRSFIDTYYKSGGTEIMQKRSTQYVDYQRRSQAFELGMRVYPFLGGNPSRSGVVIAIFPAIGMVDVQFPHGSQRYPVEDLVVDTSGDYLNIYQDDQDTVPGGVGIVPVTSRAVKKQASRVASKYMKRAIYWYKKDRTYRQCRDEEKPCCPKCKTPLGNTVYKRRGGKSEKLLACYTCLFIIKPSDIVKG